MKYLLLFCMLISSQVFASGRVTFQLVDYLIPNKIAPMADFSVYERVYGNIYWNSFLQYGVVEKRCYKDEWLNSAQFVEYSKDNFTFGLGYRMMFDIDAVSFNHGPSVRLSYLLW